MFAEEEGPAEAAIAFTDDFVDGGIAKLDAVFGKGFAKDNPQMLAAYLAACASNLNAFMTAATSMQDDAFSEALAAMEDDMGLESPTTPKKKR